MAQVSSVSFYTEEIDPEKYTKSFDLKPNFSSNLKHYNLHLSKHRNAVEPISIARCESVEIEVDAPGKEYLNLQEWFLNQESKNLAITTVDEISGTSHTLIFNGAQCFSFEDFHTVETIDVNSKNEARRFRLVFEAKSVTVIHGTNTHTTFSHL